uniref:Orf38 n=1 Tax=Daucus carota subsp. sativus TaxID=79200 RepID=I1TIE6_DAUCS|nr:orf38 [Daucus carota subsp. sativus]AEY81176.1 orf38 [Daucus carota subsp. sativus]
MNRGMSTKRITPMKKVNPLVGEVSFFIALFTVVFLLALACVPSYLIRIPKIVVPRTGQLFRVMLIAGFNSRGRHHIKKICYHYLTEKLTRRLDCSQADDCCCSSSLVSAICTKLPGTESIPTRTSFPTIVLSFLRRLVNRG